MARTQGRYPNPQTFLVGTKFTTICSSSQASSPASVHTSGFSGTSITTLPLQNWVAEFICMPTQDCYISEYSDMHTKYLMKADNEYSFGVCGMDNVYVEMAASCGDLYFRQVYV